MERPTPPTSTRLLLVPPSSSDPRTVSIISCGAPLCRRHGDIVKAFAEKYDHVRSIITAEAVAWLPSTEATPWRSPTATRGSGPRLLVVCPLTFNTANKIAQGIADTPATAALCEAIGDGIPILAVPMLKTSLFNHPAWARTTQILDSLPHWQWFDVATSAVTSAPEPIQSGQGDHLTSAFSIEHLLDAAAAHQRSRRAT